MKKITKESFNEALWDAYQEEMRAKESFYSIGTFGVWCYHKGLTERPGIDNDVEDLKSEPTLDDEIKKEIDKDYGNNNFKD